MAPRNTYTSTEISYLVAYIAKYNPEPQGRLGNNLYMTLAENPKKWPWGKGHSWQSWREHYKKNKDEIDRKIRRYQKQKASKMENGSSSTQQSTQSRRDSEPEKEKQLPRASGSSKQPSRLKPSDDNRDERKDQRRQQQRRNENHEPAKSSKPGSKQAPSKKPTGSGVQERTLAEETDALEEAEPEQQEGKRRVSQRDMGPAATSSKEPPTTKSSNDGRVEPEQQLQRRDQDGNISKTNDAALKQAPGKENVANSAPKLKAESQPPALSPVINTLTDVIDLTGEATENDGLFRELFGSDDEDSQEVDELDHTSPRSTQTNRPIEEEEHAIMEHVVILSQEPTPPKSGADAHPESIIPARSAPSKPEPRPKPRLRKPVAQDPFETPPTSPESLPRPTRVAAIATKGSLPVLVDNGFRTTLKRPRRSSTTNEDGDIWPPKRARKDKESPVRMDIDDPEPVKARPVVRQPQEVKRSQPVQVNAVASSSASKLPSNTTTSATKHATPALHNPADDDYMLGVVPQQNEPAALPTIAPAPAAAETAIKRTSSTFTLPVGALSDNDPFVARVSGAAKGKARADDNQPVPRIDLHQHQLQRRLTDTSTHSARRSSRHSSYAPSTSSALHEQPQEHPPVAIRVRASLADSAEFAELARRETAAKLAQIATSRGFLPEFAEETYLATKSLQKTEFILQKLYEGRLEQQRALYAALPDLMATPVAGGAREGSASASSDGIPAGLVLRQPTAAVPAATAQDGEHVGSTVGQSRRRSAKRKSARRSLVIRPLPDRDEYQEMSDYSPPNKSRAGQFARLQRQGRIEEAFARERQRVSGVYVPHTQLDLQQTHMQEEMSSEEEERSPSPSPKSRHDNDVVAEAEEDDHAPAREELGQQYHLAEQEHVPEYEDGEDEQHVVGEQSEEDQPSESDEQSEVDEEDAADDQGEAVVDEHDDVDDAESIAAQLEGGDDDMYLKDDAKTDGDDDDDDMYVKDDELQHGADADDESDEHDHNMSSSPPYPSSTRMLMKRLSNGRENDPEFQAEEQEHRRLALDAKERTEEKLRAFEDRHNPDLLKLWSLKWMREIEALGRPAQK